MTWNCLSVLFSLLPLLDSSLSPWLPTPVSTSLLVKVTSLPFTCYCFPSSNISLFPLSTRTLYLIFAEFTGVRISIITDRHLLYSTRWVRGEKFFSKRWVEILHINWLSKVDNRGIFGRDVTSTPTWESTHQESVIDLFRHPCSSIGKGRLHLRTLTGGDVSTRDDLIVSFVAWDCWGEESGRIKRKENVHI